MDLVEAAVLGVVQGATEYLPVSSSGHLVLVPHALGWEKAPFVFDVLVQLGTLLGVLVYFRRDLAQVLRAMVQGAASGRPFGTPDARLGWLVGLATVPAAVLGLLFEDAVEEVFSSSRAASGFLFVTAALLVLAELVQKRARRTEAEVTWKDALVVGLAQALALFPGISRSGSTIAAGMALGLGRADAARFSFLMSIPVMVGAGMLTGRKLVADPGALETLGPAVAVGFFTAALSGYLVIHWFLGFLKRRSLLWFAAYCAVAGALGLLLL